MSVQEADIRLGRRNAVGALRKAVPLVRKYHVFDRHLVCLDGGHQFVAFDLQHSRYEGPTGIVGVLHDAMSRSGLPTASLWAAVPGYASPIGVKNAIVVVDELVAKSPNLVTGAKRCFSEQVGGVRGLMCIWPFIDQDAVFHRINRS